MSETVRGFGNESLRINADGIKNSTILVATSERWTSTARLSLALRALGCEVVLLSPGDHPASVCGAVTRELRYDPLRPIHSLHQALRTVQPTVVLPADETIVCQLGELWGRLKTQDGTQDGKDRDWLHALLVRSLGEPEALCDSSSRMVLQRAAEAEGVATPATVEITNRGELPAALQRLGTPMMLKADASSGGRGVHSVESLEQAERAWTSLSIAPHMPRALMRGVLYRDWTHVRRSVRRERRGVIAQRMIAGVERTAMTVSCAGELLTVEVFEVVHTWKHRGPSSVLRHVQDPLAEAAVRTLVRRLGVTGFSGFDFIVDPVNGQPLLLERNARPTQTAHLSFGEGCDLAAAYVRTVVGRSDTRDRAAVTTKPLIALFPQELQRDPQSPVLQEAFHDVPWESPELTQRALRGQGKLLEALRAAQSRARQEPETGAGLQVR